MVEVRVREESQAWVMGRMGQLPKQMEKSADRAGSPGKTRSLVAGT